MSRFGHSISMLHIQRPYSHLEELCARSIMLTLHNPSWTCISWPTKLSADGDETFSPLRRSIWPLSLSSSLGTARQSYRRVFHLNHPLYMFNHGIENLDPLKKRISRISITEYGPFRRKMHFWWSSHVGEINKPRRCAFS